MLNIELSAISRKSVSDKLISIKKIFYQIDGFGGASTPSKFLGIIRALFTSELSMNKAKKLAIYKKILVNDDLRKVNSHLDQVVIGLWTLIEFELSKMANSVHVALANEDKQIWIFRDQHWALLYTFPVGIMAYNFSVLVGAYGEKTCFIDHNLALYVRDRCAVICFEDKTSKLAAIGSVPVFKGVSLHWVSLLLVCCVKCKQFGHVSNMYSVGGNSGVHGKQVVTNQNWVFLAGIYKKKQALIVYPVSFGGKTWAQIVGGFLLYAVLSTASDIGSVLGANSPSLVSTSLVVSGLNNCLASLECFLEILSKQVSGILKKLSFVELVLLVPFLCALSLAVSVPMAPVLDSNMALDGMLTSSPFPFLSVGELVNGFNSSSLKILTSKVDGLESKMSALEMSVSSVLAKLDLLCSGLEFSNMVFFLTKTKLRASTGPWIKNKFENIRIFTSGLEKGFLDASVAVVMNSSLAQHVLKVEKISGQVISVYLLFKNKLSVIFQGLYAGASAKTHFAQAVNVNLLISKVVNNSSFVVVGENFNEDGARRCASFRKCSDLKLRNFQGVEKTIDYVFVSEVLSSAVVGHSVVSVFEFFETDHDMVGTSVGLGSLVNNCFRDRFSARLSLLLDTFLVSKEKEDMDGINKQSLKFFKLESLVVRITKSLCLDRLMKVEHLVKVWLTLDAVRASEVAVLLENNLKLHELCSLLSKVELVRCRHIRDAINKCMESFNSNKGGMIRSILECFFHKVVLDHLVVDNELILDLIEVQSKVDEIMRISLALSNLWTHQYAPLNYVNDDVFSGMISNISLSKLSLVISGLPNSKAVGFFGILNELWKHSGAEVLACLLDLLNSCLRTNDPYEWDSILINTRLIALIETARKILSKVLSNWIFSVCSEFDILHGDNFSVLRSTSIQFPVFVIGSIVEDVLKKDQEIWLVLQNMHKAYDLVGWYHLKSSLKCIKMCSRFIEFFGNIHKNRINRIMTDFGLLNSYIGEMFFSLLWRIFYDSLLCEIKRQKHLCDYRINSNFVTKSGRVKFSGGMSSFFVAGAFVDNTIWIGNGQTLTQYILDITSEFFDMNDISINNNKTVGESHRYLGIFLFIEGFSKPSLTKTHADIRFFSNLVLRKVVLNKQFFYLVLAVFQPIICYHMQFSFVAKSKGLRTKAFLPKNFPIKALHHSSLYGLKLFEQVQAEAKVTSVISFSNALGIFDCLFKHRTLDLQLRVCPLNNFLAGVVRIFLDTSVFLVNKLPNAFCKPGHFPMSEILGASCYFDIVCSLKCFGVAFVPVWFSKTFVYMCSSLVNSNNGEVLNSSGLFCSSNFLVVCECLHEVWIEKLNIFTDSSLSDLGTLGVACEAAAYFFEINLGVGIRIQGLLSSILVKLQAIAVALKCVPSSCSIVIYSNSQMALNAYMSEYELGYPDFCNRC
ncbi:hypothetical protein G9A89_019029 [Geosiphon pyriformis]|nr:hypothetical protein G9A89_019029 [Geosiphon pyriformis]